MGTDEKIIWFASKVIETEHCFCCVPQGGCSLPRELAEERLAHWRTADELAHVRAELDARDAAAPKEDG